MGRPVCCPVLKIEGKCADVFVVVILCFDFVFLSGFRGPAHEPHVPTTYTILPHQRPAPMAPVQTGGPPPPSAAAMPAATAAAAAATPAAACSAIPSAATHSALLSICYPKIAKTTPVIVWQGFPMLQQQSSFPGRQRPTRRLTSLQLSVKRCHMSGPTSRSFNRRFRPD